MAKQKPLYFGTWMSFCLNQKPFQNTCGDAVAIWQKCTPTYLMDSDINARAGFMNLFTPDSNNTGFPLQVGNTLTESLSLNNSSSQKNLPYRIVNDPKTLFISPVSQHTYAQTVSVVLNKGTLFSAVFSAMAQKTKAVQYTLKFETISNQTINVMGAYDAGFYEGAANVFLCQGDSCELAGTGFVEQMGYK